ncbi:MAG: SemiSWEET transporter [Candidatus Omnitrophica bacterium]|nr:SemiSWEET transporter [Candidatus Omnitrophota bacterium]
MLWKIIGMSAAVLTMFSFLPQIFKVLKTKSEKDLSLMTLLQLSSGVLLWIVYGVARRDPIIIIANVITLATLLILLNLYFYYGRKK